MMEFTKNGLCMFCGEKLELYWASLQDMNESVRCLCSNRQKWIEAKRLVRELERVPIARLEKIKNKERRKQLRYELEQLKGK